MNIQIIFENDQLVVINKPAGLRVHSDGKNDVPIVVDWINENYPTIKEVGEPMKYEDKYIYRPGIVHRLDEQTSGALIIAKTQESFLNLKNQFKDRLIKKEYHAFVWGHFKDAKGIVNEPIGRNINDFRRWHSGRGIRGERREAETEYEVITQFKSGEDDFSFVRLFPKTGRTHQLRVHMKFLQRPIIADNLYAPTKPLVLGFNRLALHARKISFEDLGGQNIQCLAPYPDDFENTVRNIAQIDLL